MRREELKYVLDNFAILAYLAEEGGRCSWDLLNKAESDKIFTYDVSLDMILSEEEHVFKYRKIEKE